MESAKDLVGVIKYLCNGHYRINKYSSIKLAYEKHTSLIGGDRRLACRLLQVGMDGPSYSGASTKYPSERNCSLAVVWVVAVRLLKP